MELNSSSFYIILFIILLIFLFCIFIYLPSIFKENILEIKEPEPVIKTKSKVPEGFVLILRRDGCIYCQKLDEYISSKKIDRKKLLIANFIDNHFDYNENVLDLEQIERNSIINIAHEIKYSGVFAFPTIIKNNDVTLGFAPEKILDNIFEV